MASRLAQQLRINPTFIRELTKTYNLTYKHVGHGGNIGDINFSMLQISYDSNPHRFTLFLLSDSRLMQKHIFTQVICERDNI